MTTDSEEPDFAALRAQRNARVRASIQTLANEWGLDVESLKTTYRPTACYCACASGGPCEHKWDGAGWTSEDGCGWLGGGDRVACTCGAARAQEAVATASVLKALMRSSRTLEY